jgi:hypothetical protein
MRISLALIAVAVASIAGTGWGSETIICYGPHYGVEFLDAKSVDLWDDAKVDKQLTENGITFNIAYEDPNGVGFRDAGLGASRRARLEDAFRYVAQVLNESGTLDVSVLPSQGDGTGPLATGATFFSDDTSALQMGSAFTRLKSGVKPFPGTPEIQITVDFGYTYNVGAGNPGGGEVDLLSVLIHEVTHGIGFLALVGADGNSRIPGGPYSVLDSLAFRINSGNALVAGNPPAFNAQIADLTSNNVAFGGLEAVTAFGGNPLLDSRPPFRPGGSLSHFDPDITGGAVMATSISPGDVVREYSPVEIGALVDLGYDNAADPGEALPPCNLASAALLSPAAGNIQLAANQTQVAVNFTTQIAFLNNPPCTQGPVQVAYILNGSQVATSSSAPNNFLSTRNLAAGNYTLQAVATVIATNNQVASATRNFSVVAAATPATTVTPFPTVNFGEVASGSSAVTDFTVTNSGSGSLNGTAQVTGNGFTLVTGSPYTLSAGNSAQVRVRFTPPAEGLFTGAVTFTGGGNGNVVVNLSGTGGKAAGGGCSCGTPRPPADHVGDGLVAGLALSALLYATRRRVAVRVRGN